MTFRSSIPVLVLIALIGAGVLYALNMAMLMNWVLLGAVIIGVTPLVLDVAKSLLARHFGVDILAIVAIIAATLLGQYLAGAVILLMLSGGEALEAFALRRARKDFSTLVSNAPVSAHKKTGDVVTDVAVQEVVPGDVVIVKPGEVVPMDGEVISGISAVDESMLTGESLPLEKVKGSMVMSGSINMQGVLEVKVLRPSSESQYEQIIRLVREAEENRAPFVRLADRYSVWFTVLAFTLAGIAWAISGDALRALAVLVVATPCPLILATPIAFASGISRAAKRGIIIKSGGEMEKLAQAVCVVFDKTGTLTFGVPDVVKIFSYGTSEQEVVRIAASVDQLSAHVLASALKKHALGLKTDLFFPDEFHETIGQGVQAMFSGQTYIVGRLSWLAQQGVPVSEDIIAQHDAEREMGKMAVGVAMGGQLIGVLFLEDTIRDDVKQLLIGLPRLGIQHVVMLTGDKKAVADRIAAEAGIALSNVHAELLPDEKVAEVKRLQAKYNHVVMVGDGVNDAPALATADVGIALAARGSTAASESADIVVLVDKAERVGDALRISRRVLHIAKQSIFIGIGLSVALMLVAVAGYITPVFGAMLQEAIDVIVIFNALRVLIIRFEGAR